LLLQFQGTLLTLSRNTFFPEPPSHTPWTWYIKKGQADTLAAVGLSGLQMRFEEAECLGHVQINPQEVNLCPHHLWAVESTIFSLSSPCSQRSGAGGLFHEVKA
jgi:hypothetical protein